MVYGGRISHRHVGRIADRATEIVVGGEARYDDIGTVGLFHTVSRVRRETIFAQHELQWTSWLRSNVGLRADRYRFRAREPMGSPDRQNRLSPNQP